MKKNSYIIKGLLAVLILSVTLVSCSEDAMDKVNADKNHSTSVPSKFILADVITSSAFNNVGGDLNTYLSIYVEHAVGVDNQLYNAEHRSNEPSAASTFDNSWLNCYNALKNARVAITRCSAGGLEEGNNVTKGIAEVLAALNSGLIADMFGDTPWSQAALVNSTGTPLYLNPKIDTQADIYKGINQYLDDAIVDLKGTDKISGIGSYDLLYGGGTTGTAKWLKLAYGLKARYTMHLLAKSADKTADLNKILSYLDNSFTSVDDQAAFAIYDATNLNPSFDFQWSRDGLGVSKSMSDKLVARNDPRSRRVYFDPNSWLQLTGTSDKAFNPGPNGETEQVKNTYTYSMYMYAQTAPTLLMSYHEALFLRAEALCRLNRSAEALPVLKAAVVAAIANTEVSVTAALNAPSVIVQGGLTEKTAAITPAEAGTFFDTQIAPLFTANPLQETMIQKYIAFWGASGESTETYNDIRRMKALGENFVTLANPLNTTKFPLRLPYGTSDVTTNPAVEAAYGDGTYVYTIPVWWAGGAR